ncbi:AHH domain-containing protein [Bradyrhizobium sp. CIAT3101]|uniref:AHH domain-containing protein n=1 Tax=Bradyrhizobium sp. CIAT3101 TaxID=439387 RepID=UPI0024B084E8|nr:AHH domain-containing protein [Bradyrhizobium sp. CIAT3101]WFU83770.1 AHH domain-containing protein [Bradyrhizobium sp. CIAT3101]
MAILWEHHIIPKRFAGHRALVGTDIDAPSNLIYLPQSRQLAAQMEISPHSGGHLGSYYAVKKTLNRIAKISDPVSRQAEIRNLQDAMRLGLANGDLYANDPGNGVDTEEINEKLLADYNGYLAARPNQVQEMRDREQRGIDTGNPNLRKLSAILGNREREKLLSGAITNNPGVDITAGNRDLGGTPWQSKFTAIDSIPYVSRTPGFAPVNPRDFPALPESPLPSPDDLNRPEGFTRIDPRLSFGLPGLPLPDPDWQRRWQLPPSTAKPPDAQVLQFHPETGQPLRLLSDLSPVMGPAAPVDDDAALWAGIAVLGAGALLIPGVDVAAIGAALLAGATASTVVRPASGAAASSDAGTDASVFSKGAAPYNAFSQALPATGASVGSGNLRGSTFGRPISSRAPDQEADHASSFDDRFGNWTGTPAGTAPAQAPRLLGGAPGNTATGAVAPEEVRRLTRVNESNAGSVFASGTAPVPYLLPPELNDRPGKWSMLASMQSPGASRSIGAFADEPSHVVPPPIWGVGDPANPRDDAGEWFSRWIQPLLRQE